MSILNVLLLSTTPIAALGVLLGLGRFEKWALEDHTAARVGADSIDVTADAAPAAIEADLAPLEAQPLQAA